MRKNIFLAVASLIVVSLLGACAAGAGGSAGSPPPVRSMSVTGQGRVTITPDLAYVTVGVHSEAESVGEALKSNTSQAQSVAQVLQNMGIDAKDIQTSNFNVYPQQKIGPQGEQLGIVYVVDNTVYVTVRDLSKLGQLLDQVVSSGANNINGIQFDSSTKEKAMSEARQQAIANAKAQADELAKAAGVTLGPIQTLNVYSNPQPIPILDAKGGAGASAAGQVPVSAGQLVITADASMTYEIK